MRTHLSAAPDHPLTSQYPGLATWTVSFFQCLFKVSLDEIIFCSRASRLFMMPTFSSQSSDRSHRMLASSSQLLSCSPQINLTGVNAAVLYCGPLAGVTPCCGLLTLTDSAEPISVDEDFNSDRQPAVARASRRASEQGGVPATRGERNTAHRRPSRLERPIYQSSDED